VADFHPFGDRTMGNFPHDSVDEFVFATGYALPPEPDKSILAFSVAFCGGASSCGTLPYKATCDRI